MDLTATSIPVKRNQKEGTIMKLKYWGKDSKKAEELIGQSPVTVADEDEFNKLIEKLDGMTVMTAKLGEEVACPKCSEVNQFIAERHNGVLEDVFCNACGISITNASSCDDELEAKVSQEDWDTIVFELTC